MISVLAILDALDGIARHGLLLLVGTTGILAASTLVTMLTREPRARARAATLGAICTVLWGVASILPLPRPWKIDTRPTPARREMPTREMPASAALTEKLAPLKAASGAAEMPSHAPSTRDVAAPAAPRAPHEPWTTRLLAGLWLLGLAAFAGRLSLAQLRLRRLLQRSKPAPDEARDLLPRGARRAPRLRVVDEDVSPFVTGVFRPQVVLPRAWSEDSVQDDTRRRDLAHILAHEVAHVAEGHVADRLIFALVRPLLWFHPLFYVLRREAESAAEHVADAIAAGREPLSYAETLLRLAPTTGASPGQALTSPIYRSKSEFSRRIEMLLKSSKQACSTKLHARDPRWRKLAHHAAALCFLVLAIGASGLEGSAQARDPRPASEAPKAGTLGKFLQDRSLAQQLEALIRRISRNAIDEAKAEDAIVGTLPPDASRYVRVRPGDSLWSIAHKHLGDANRFRELLAFNPKIKNNKLRVGQKLRLPDVNAALAPAKPAPSATQSSWKALDLVRQVIELEGKESLAQLELNQAKTMQARHAAETRLRVTTRTREAVQAAIAGERRATEIELEGVKRRLSAYRGVLRDARAEVQLARLEARLDLLLRHDGKKRRRSKKRTKTPEPKARSK